MTLRSTHRLACILLALSATACATSAGGSRSAASAGHNSASRSANDRTWTNDRGEPSRFADFRGTPFVVTMFYRSCQVRCPMTFAKMRRIEAELKKHGRNYPLVLITLDPQHDSPKRLSEIRAEEQLSPTWHLWTGDRDTTRELAQALGVRVVYDDNHIDHDVKIVLFDAKGAPSKTFSDWGFAEKDIVSP